MRRFAVMLAMLGLIAGLFASPASAGPPQCQVIATVLTRSCSFVATSYSVNLILIGEGSLSVYDSLGLYSATYCPYAGAMCLGGAYKAVSPGQIVVLRVNVGFGRVSTGLP